VPADRERRAQEMNEETMRRVKKKLVVFYLILLFTLSVFGTLTAVFFTKGDANPDHESWQIVYCKVVPIGIVALFGLFNIWIQCSNRSISRQIIHPWVSCRCHLHIFLFILPLIMTVVEVLGIYLYIKNWKSDNLNKIFFCLFAISLFPATWFQFTLGKWCVFVRRYVVVRERRVRQLLISMD